LTFLTDACLARKALDLDLAPVEWFSPLGVVAVLAACLRAQEGGLRVSVRVPDHPNVRAYLAQVGFYAELRRRGWFVGQDLLPDPAAPGAACLPVSSLSTMEEVESVAAQLFDVCEAANVPSSLYETVQEVALELTNNAREHGSRCYLLVQIYSGKTSGTPGVHLAVADFGGGFAESLKPRYGPMPEADAVLKGFEERVTSTEDPGRGLGLPYIQDRVDKHKGATLSVISRRAQVQRQDGEFVRRGLPDFGGTLAEAYFPYPHPNL
jgi:hypothetical protein